MTTTSRLPAVFVGHGSPMNALEDNAYTRSWREVAESLPLPKAILTVSAHWFHPGKTFYVGSAAQPETIYDFYGFPEALYQLQYPAPGAPERAQALLSRLQAQTDLPVAEDAERGLDHGIWSVLRFMYPNAEVPVYQLSLPQQASLADHVRMAQALSALRDEGVLVLGTGNVVHNLRTMRFGAPAFDWAKEFMEHCQELIASQRWEAVAELLVNPTQVTRLAVPTPEHFLPLLYVLGAGQTTEPLQWFNEDYALGSVSMHSLIVG